MIQFIAALFGYRRKPDLEAHRRAYLDAVKRHAARKHLHRAYVLAKCEQLRSET